MQWAKQDASAAQIERDVRECRDAAWREARGRHLQQHPVAPAVMQDSLGRRLNVYPTGPFSDPHGEQLVEESRLTTACMRARGYQQVPAAGKG